MPVIKKPSREELDKDYLIDKMKVDEMAEKYNVSTGSIYTWISDYGLSRTKKRNILTEDQKKEIREKNERNLNVRIIANQMGLKYYQVYSYLKTFKTSKNNVPDFDSDIEYTPFDFYRAKATLRAKQLYKGEVSTSVIYWEGGFISEQRAN